MNINKLHGLLAILGLLLILPACQSNKSTVGGYLGLDTDVTINFVIDSDINPDDSGTASPVFMRMYELKSNKMMKKSDFIDLYEQDKKTLGADMVTVHKLKRFTPGEERSEQFVLDKDTSYIAVYAEFSNFSESKFKLIAPVVLNNVFRNSYTIRVSGNELILEK